MERKNKIVIAAEIYPPDIGGPATYSERLFQELKKEGHDAVLVCYGTTGRTLHDEDGLVRIKRSVLKFPHYLRYMGTLFAISKKADVIYAQGPISSGVPAIIAGKLRRIRTVVKIVGDYAWERARNKRKSERDIDEFQSNPNGGLFVMLLRMLESRTVRHSDAVIVPSEYLRDMVIGWGAKSENVSVVYNSFHGNDEEAKSVYGDKSEENLVVSVGRLVPWKGFDTVIRAVHDLQNKIPNLRLEIIGGGPEKEKLEKLIKELLLRQRVTIGPLSQEDALKRMARARVFVLNSGYEGLSHTILEAFALGTPVIASRKGGNIELIENNYNGILVEYNNKEELKEAMLRLLLDERIQNEFAFRSEEKIEKFSFESMINGTKKILFSDV